MKTNGIVRNWSYSALSQYEKCPAQYKYARIEKRPQPESPHLARGNETHALLEAKVRQVPAIPGPAVRAEGVGHLDGYVAELITQKPRVEEMWYLDSEWRLLQAGGKYHPATWLIVKMDVYLPRARGRNPRIVDWKTGKRYDDHEQQAQLYALAADAYENGASDVVDVDMVYVDDGEDPISKWEFDVGEQGEELRGSWNERAMTLFTETKWEPTPSYMGCNWCPFSRRKGGPCRAG